MSMGDRSKHRRGKERDSSKLARSDQLLDWLLTRALGRAKASCYFSRPLEAAADLSYPNSVELLAIYT